MVNGTFSEEAGATRDRVSQQDVLSHRGRGSRIGGSKDGDERNTDSRPDVHCPGIICYIYGAAFEDSRQELNVRSTSEIDDALPMTGQGSNIPRTNPH